MTSIDWLLATWYSRPHPPWRRHPAHHPGPPAATRPVAEPDPSRPAPAAPAGVRRLLGDRGEGVISVAIAVLIMAFLGAAMWLGFQSMWRSTSEKTNTQVERIGDGP